MKHLKTLSEIDSICKKYNIKNWTLNPDNSIDVDGDVDLRGQLFHEQFPSNETKKNNWILKELPLKFRNVNGTFDCRGNELISLENGPFFVGQHYYCSYNKLKTLKGCPTKVNRFLASDNLIFDLEGSPEIVLGDFNVSDNPNLTTLKGGPKQVGGYYGFNDTQVTDINNFSKSLLIHNINNTNNPKTIFFNRTPFSYLIGMLYNYQEHGCEDFSNCTHTKDMKYISELILEIIEEKWIDENKVSEYKLLNKYWDLIDNDYALKPISDLNLLGYEII